MYLSVNNVELTDNYLNFAKNLFNPQPDSVFQYFT